jgi:5-methyltetrahydrofolate corrinoid/iron sulfur protein methyltransferase
VLLAADNIHALNPVVAEALKRLDPAPIRELALKCEQSGAHLIDLNPGWLSRRHEDRIEFLVETVQEVTQVRLILDSPNPRVLSRGLAVCKQKPILNALSLEEQKLDEILPLAAENQTTLVLLLMDARSFTPPLLDEKIAIAIELRERSLSAGLKEQDLIFDPVLPNLSWEDALPRIAEDVKTVRLLASGALFQEPCDTMVGLSNLRSGRTDHYPWRVEETCMHLLAGAGLRVLLANILRPEMQQAYQFLHPMI